MRTALRGNHLLAERYACSSLKFQKRAESFLRENNEPATVSLASGCWMEKSSGIPSEGLRRANIGATRAGFAIEEYKTFAALDRSAVNPYMVDRSTHSRRHFARSAHSVDRRRNHDHYLVDWVD
jgi:hypothetical protein